MKVKWLLRAVNDLEDIQSYIALDNPTAAGKKIEKILTTDFHLNENPFIGRIGRVVKTRELVIPDTPYIVAYRLQEDFVEILRVMHGFRKWPTRF